MTSIRDLFAKSEPSSEIVEVDLMVDGIDVTVKVEVREQTVNQQFDILDRSRNSNGDIDIKTATIEGVLATSFDPETGDKAFDDADRDMLGDKSAKAFATLFAATNRAAGIESEDEAVSDLDDGPTDETSTS